MNRTITLSILAVLALSSSILYAYNNSWRLVKDAEGIKVFNRKVGNSPLNESKAITIVKAQINEVYDMVLGIDNIPKWMFKVSRCEMLKQESDDTFFVLAEIDAPWPIYDRDLILRFDITERSATKISCKLTGVPDYIKPRENFVRIPYYKGAWHWTQLNTNDVEIVQQSHIDPGGAIPKWLANAASSEAPFNTLRNMRNIFAEQQ